VASRGKGIDLLTDMPPGHYMAELVCHMAKVGLDVNPEVEEFRATIAGFYVRVDGEEYLIECQRVGKLLDLSQYRTLKVCECGQSIYDPASKLCHHCIDDLGQHAGCEGDRKDEG